MFYQTIPTCPNANTRIENIVWELKTPTSNGKYTIEHALKAAIKQSSNIIIDSRYSKMHQKRFIRQVTYHAKQLKHKPQRLLLVTQDGKILVII